MEFGTEVNTEKTKYLLLSRHSNAGQNHDIKIANRYFKTTVTNQTLNQEQIKTRLKLVNASCHSVQNLSSSRLLYKNVKIRTYKTIILLLVLYGCET
jgi:hypothetical protein